MSAIVVNNLTFSYPGSSKIIFNKASFVLDTNWKLGLVGRNGSGKTTFFNLLLRKYEYSGKIESKVNFSYFPLFLNNKEISPYEIAEKHLKDYRPWILEKEANLLNLSANSLKRSFSTLSNGEQVKVLLCVLFLKNNNFLLIDEPTNHIDLSARKIVANYLNSKKGFIVVSHDRRFLDMCCIDHVLYINKTSIGIERGDFSSYFKNKTEKDNWELNENKKLKNSISLLEKNAKQITKWATKTEKSKYNIENGVAKDKGYIGHKSAKIMKRAILAQKRKEKQVQAKASLLKDIEVIDELKINPLNNIKGRLLNFCDFSVVFSNRKIFRNVNFCVESKERVQLKGPSGSGKSSILKIILGEDISCVGKCYKVSNLKFSYVPQNILNLTGNLSFYAEKNNIKESLFKSILIKLGFNRNHLDKEIDTFSNGQKKKILIAKSLCEQAHIYIWDEPLNYIDVFSRIQIENLLLNNNLTMVFVEHDEAFSDKIATKTVEVKV